MLLVEKLVWVRILCENLIQLENICSFKILKNKEYMMGKLIVNAVE